MSFEHGWVLLLVLLPIGWGAREWFHTRRKRALILKVLAIVCVLLALADPRLQTSDSRMGVAILVDTSLSVSEEDLTRASQLASSIEGARGRHWTRVIPFARSARPAEAAERASSWQLQQTSGEEGLATDLEAALREALASLPAGLVPRVALISDGKENRGSIARGATLFRRMGVPVDTFALTGRPEPEIIIEAVTMPAVAFTGERFAVDLAVRSPRSSTGEIEIAAEGKPLGAQPVALVAG